jgi:catechol 2,3-dioxygenase-like lactoylglutathione lyase family enzyme
MNLELQHVSIPIPRDGRVVARSFYAGVLELQERDVPPKLDPSELIWFRVGGDLELHLFASDESPPGSQHLCLRVDVGLEELRTRLEEAGVAVVDTEEIIGRPRFMCRDPFGNRIELTQWE